MEFQGYNLSNHFSLFHEKLVLFFSLTNQPCSKETSSYRNMNSTGFFSTVWTSIRFPEEKLGERYRKANGHLQTGEGGGLPARKKYVMPECTNVGIGMQTQMAWRKERS